MRKKKIYFNENISVSIFKVVKCMDIDPILTTFLKLKKNDFQNNFKQKERK